LTKVFPATLVCDGHCFPASFHQDFQTHAERQEDPLSIDLRKGPGTLKNAGLLSCSSQDIAAGAWPLFFVAEDRSSVSRAGCKTSFALYDNHDTSDLDEGFVDADVVLVSEDYASKVSEPAESSLDCISSPVSIPESIILSD
jgi:hypothetical protein